MDKKLKTYRIIPGDSDVYAVSLVDEPAVESTFIAMAKQQVPMEFRAVETGEKRMVYGVVLRADFPVYRVLPDGEECYFVFDAECIERLEQKFVKNGGQFSWTKDHMDFAPGLTMTESWIVSDPECDKAKAIGLENFSKGSWIGGCKVDDDETWKQIKEGRFAGFSIESWVAFDEITKKEDTETEMAKETKTIEQEVREEGFWEKFEAVLTKVMGKKEADKQDEDETPAEEETPEEIAEEVIEQVEEAAETPEEAQEDLQAVIDELKAEIEAKDAEIEELKKKNANLSKQMKQPSAKPVVSNKQSKAGAKDWREIAADCFEDR